MVVTPVQVDIVRPGSSTLPGLVDASVSHLAEGSVLVVTSKVVSLCENAVVPIGSRSKDELVRQESAYHLPAELSKYHHHFTIAHDTLVGVAGIDESNGDGNYILWPRDPQATANQLRTHLQQRFGLRQVGVIITDSTSQPLRLGTIGIALSHSGFSALHDYRGEPDLFDRPLGTTRANVAGGLAAAAVVAMGEGRERTPLCILHDLPFVQFQDRAPTDEELHSLRVSMADDLFAPMFDQLPWERGEQWNEAAG